MKAITETRAIIDDRANRLGWTFGKVAMAAGVTEATLRKKLKKPELLCGTELKGIFDAMKMPAEQKAAILKEVFG